jgi:hypothetical protein
MIKWLQIKYVWIRIDSVSEYFIKHYLALTISDEEEVWGGVVVKALRY